MILLKVSVCAQVIGSNSSGEITHHLINICRLCEKCYLFDSKTHAV